MKVLKEVTITDPTALANRIARDTLTRLVADVGLPEAIANAPGGNLPTKIESMPVRMTSSGKFRTGIRFPGKYRVVEEGTGTFVGGSIQTIEPVKRKALHLPFGFFKRVKWVGQPGQHFARNALEHVAQIFPAEFANDLNAALSRSRGTKTTKRR